ncbi:MAG: addiction module toxin RelE [Gemmatimonadetes bacterium]|nr:addiction module toxin RelE [Gemmatimonadota bacterium]MYF63802.1 addiction module toxin RelE [Rhodothermaceae bacterium]MYK53485.1 addiction module toxin RelE [Gemmatimonadota bacterium]
MHTVVELPEYMRQAKRLLSENDGQELINYLAEYPQAGIIMRGTGGIRKLRWSRTGTGKRGGVRVIYYYHNEQIPIYLLTLYSKGVKDDLTSSERRALRELVQTLIETERPHE